MQTYLAAQIQVPQRDRSEVYVVEHSRLYATDRWIVNYLPEGTVEAQFVTFVKWPPAMVKFREFVMKPLEDLQFLRDNTRQQRRTSHGDGSQLDLAGDSKEGPSG